MKKPVVSGRWSVVSCFVRAGDPPAEPGAKWPTPWIYACRVVGRHRHHRHPDGAVASRRAKREGNRAAKHLPQQHAEYRVAMRDYETSRRELPGYANAIAKTQNAARDWRLGRS